MSSRDIVWASLPPPLGRRPVCVLTRNAAIPVLHRVTVAPITTVVRGILTEVPVGGDEGLEQPSVISCDNVLTVAKSALDSTPVGRLNGEKRSRLDTALRYALQIRS